MNASPHVPAHTLMRQRLQWGVTVPTHIEPVTQTYHAKSIAEVVLEDLLEEEPNCGATLTGRWVTDWVPAFWIEIDAVPTSYTSASPVQGPAQDPEATLYVQVTSISDSNHPTDNHSTVITLPREQAEKLVQMYDGYHDWTPVYNRNTRKNQSETLPLRGGCAQ